MVFMKLIAVIDCNNFFVSCERLFRPDLNKKPVVVLSGSDGCVVARSQEIKDKGIPMGVPYFQVKDILKDINAVCFSSHFALYRDVSARVFSVVKRICTNIEQYSIDEAFFVLEVATEHEALEFIKKLKQCVELEVGIPVSVGVSETKTRAKLVNAYAKKNGGVGIFVGDQFLTIFGEYALAAVWGVGRQLEVRYRQLGVKTINDLLQLSGDYLKTRMHTAGLELQAELLGVVVHTIETQKNIPKSTMSTRSFRSKTTDEMVIKDALSYHVRHVFEELRSLDLVASEIVVILYTARHSDWILRGGSAKCVFELPTNDTVAALKEAHLLLKSLYESNVPYNKTGVVAYGLMPRKFVPKSLFELDTVVSKTTALDQVIDGLNLKFGKNKISLGRFTNSEKWQSKTDLRSPSYTTVWSDIPTVKCN